jgi:hypothetical protein
MTYVLTAGGRNAVGFSAGSSCFLFDPAAGASCSFWPSDCAVTSELFSKETGKKENRNMLWTIFLVLLVLWFLGLVTSYTLGGYIHILLVFALVALVFQLISGRRVI